MFTSEMHPFVNFMVVDIFFLFYLLPFGDASWCCIPSAGKLRSAGG